MNDFLADWLAGRLTSEERIWTAIMPALVLLAYGLVAGLLYMRRSRFRGPFQDEEIGGRGDGGFTPQRLRHFFAWVMRPWWGALASVRFPPNAVTMLSLIIALGAGVAVAAGRFALGGWLFIFAGALDFLDGRLARVTGRTSLSGAALDSVLDRYVESAFLIGLSWYYRDQWVLVACLFALTGSFLVPYVRAKGEALGVQVKDSGFMQRPERVLVLGGGTALSPILEVVLDATNPHPLHRVAVLAVVLLGIGSHISAVQRLILLMGRLGGSRLHSNTAIHRPLKSALANAAATAVDFAVATTLVYATLVHPAIATAVGCTVGAATSFALSRSWAFEAAKGAMLQQVVRYGAISLVTMALNAGGVALLLLIQVQFIAAWVVTRCLIFATWSYPLQRDFVFAASDVAMTSVAVPVPEPSGVSNQ